MLSSSKRNKMEDDIPRLWMKTVCPTSSNDTPSHESPSPCVWTGPHHRARPFVGHHGGWAWHFVAQTIAPLGVHDACGNADSVPPPRHSFAFSFPNDGGESEISTTLLTFVPCVRFPLQLRQLFLVARSVQAFRRLWKTILRLKLAVTFHGVGSSPFCFSTPKLGGVPLKQFFERTNPKFGTHM